MTLCHVFSVRFCLFTSCAPDDFHLHVSCCRRTYCPPVGVTSDGLLRRSRGGPDRARSIWHGKRRNPCQIVLGCGRRAGARELPTGLGQGGDTCPGVKWAPMDSHPTHPWNRGCPKASDNRPRFFVCGHTKGSLWGHSLVDCFTCRANN